MTLKSIIEGCPTTAFLKTMMQGELLGLPYYSAIKNVYNNNLCDIYLLDVDINTIPLKYVIPDIRIHDNQYKPFDQHLIEYEDSILDHYSKLITDEKVDARLNHIIDNIYSMLYDCRHRSKSSGINTSVWSVILCPMILHQEITRLLMSSGFRQVLDTTDNIP
ncbi:hypothetical protein RF11_05809 [Thelohanellus kitauei]|uniref:Uncharacterized protein n=1 Tax=Thelohanellus kitauei TaxID=669202 RepID=A0A0C2IW65_THEKT|nr:hypothetical protein RF11_05809 [Thelohanellus kitauei]